MIRVRIDRAGRVITIEGHAGYAEKGKDIVCAAVSCLAWTFVTACHRKGWLLEAQDEDGRMEIRYTEDAGAYVDFAEEGFRMLEYRHSDHVRVMGEKPGGKPI